jgi:hypothetical protein
MSELSVMPFIEVRSWSFLRMKSVLIFVDQQKPRAILAH